MSRQSTVWASGPWPSIRCSLDKRLVDFGMRGRRAHDPLLCIIRVMECGWGWDEVMWLISLRSKGQMVSWNIGFYSTAGSVKLLNQISSDLIYVIKLFCVDPSVLAVLLLFVWSRDWLRTFLKCSLGGNIVCEMNSSVNYWETIILDLYSIYRVLGIAVIRCRYI